MNPEHDKKVKNLQLALAMGGVAVNPMVAELIFMISKGIDEKGDSFNVKDAQIIFSAVQSKHQMQQQNPGFRLPPEIEQMIKEGKLGVAKFPGDAVPDSKHDLTPTPKVDPEQKEDDLK